MLTYKLWVLEGMRSQKLRENTGNGASRYFFLFLYAKSRSPAMDTIRRVSRRVLERMHVIRKKDETFLMPELDIDTLPLDDYCKR